MNVQLLEIITPPHNGPLIYYCGPNLSEGLKPTIIYFSLSAQASLSEDPFNQPVLSWIKSGFRVFSWDLPFHGPNLDPHQAMHSWAAELSRNRFFISDFIEICQKHLQFLIDYNWIEKSSVGVAGLSRGGFIATHLAAKTDFLKTVLGFSPMTQSPSIDEFKNVHINHQEEINLIKLIDQLSHVSLRFYIGNHDKRVQTEACYQFIHSLSHQIYEKGIRSPPIELIVYPSIGFKGHGTPSNIFENGSQWMMTQLTQ
jgi:esterase FrsA